MMTLVRQILADELGTLYPVFIVDYINYVASETHSVKWYVLEHVMFSRY